MKERRQVHKDEEGLFIVFGGNLYRPKYMSELEEGEFVLLRKHKGVFLRIRNKRGELWILTRENVIYRNKQGVM